MLAYLGPGQGVVRLVIHEAPVAPCDAYHGVHTRVHMRLCYEEDVVRPPESITDRAGPVRPRPFVGFYFTKNMLYQIAFHLSCRDRTTPRSSNLAVMQGHALTRPGGPCTSECFIPWSQHCGTVSRAAAKLGPIIIGLAALVSCLRYLIMPANYDGLRQEGRHLVESSLRRSADHRRRDPLPRCEQVLQVGR